MNVLTIDEMTRAIKNSIDRKGMHKDQARQMAEHVMNFFGFSDRIIDNVLEPEDRDVFYMMEDTDLLLTEREETTLYDGREWRIHYWLLRRDKIMEMARSKGDDGKILGEESSVYEELPEDIWAKRRE